MKFQTAKKEYELQIAFLENNIQTQKGQLDRASLEKKHACHSKKLAFKFME